MSHETYSQAWRLRYGSSTPEGHPCLERFLSHRSIRKYSLKPVSEATIRTLVACAQSASTSSNLQLYSIISVEEPNLREEVAKLCSDQDQVRKAPWFFLFCVDHYRLRQAANQVGEEALGLSYTEFYTMATIDAALAAERMVSAAEALDLGICYIGAARNHPEKMSELLGLPTGVFGVFGLCIGYPAEDLKADIKPRLAQDAIFFRDKYEADISVEDYNVRMAEFYTAQKMKGDINWAMRSGRRVDEHHMDGREGQKPFLLENGFIVK
ncbi:MAG: NADPH-dependent oxidoreductase [Armatimonadetes bacterium]|nr:NADPH-dependent oxidoreductase [Armatimonadota bacterium]